MRGGGTIYFTFFSIDGAEYPYNSATALKDMAAAASSPGGSPDEYKTHIENYFASKLIPGAPSTRYCSFLKKMTLLAGSTL